MTYIPPKPNPNGTIQRDIDGVIRAVESGVPYEDAMKALTLANELERQNAMRKVEEAERRDNADAERRANAPQSK
jgi:hypothetical protein